MVSVYYYLSNICIISTASLTQTTPSYTPVCPGDRLIFTCVATGSGRAVVWRRNNGVVLQYGQTIPSFPDFILNITSYNTITTLIVAAWCFIPCRQQKDLINCEVL